MINRCEYCKYYIDLTCSTEDGTEYDGFCLIKGDDFELGCNLVFPFKQIIGEIKLKQYRYYQAHEYDGFGDLYKEIERKQTKLYELIKEHLHHAIKDDHKQRLCSMNEAFYWIMSEYEDFAHPIVHKTLKQQWKDVLKATFNATLGKYRWIWRK